MLGNVAKILYNWLPGSAPPFGKVHTFRDSARENGLERYWPGGSKLPAIQYLLEGALLEHRLVPLIITVAREGIKYRNKKGQPITRAEVEALNKPLQELGYRISELHEPSFLNSLPTTGGFNHIREPTPSPSEMGSFLSRYAQMLQNPDYQSRGYELQGFLHDLFEAFGLRPHGPFRVIGEEIDGSFVLDGEIYLLEARWRKDKARKEDLSSFSDKVQRKSEWTRGLFVSISGFSKDSLDAMTRGRSPNLVIMSGMDLERVVNSEVNLNDMLRTKVRKLAEKGELVAEA
jgi:hypothetical protein